MQETVVIKVVSQKKESIPFYASKEAAGADLRACINEPIVVMPGASLLIPTGLKVEIPQGYEIQVRPRSGLALKNQITVLNTPGTIDSDYRGEIGVILINHGKEPFVITDGMRIAQMVVAKVSRACFVEAEQLELTHRAEGGFGHSGTH